MTTIDERVRAASAALIRGEDANWELARLTWESTHDKSGPVPAGSDRLSMAEWCRRVQETSGRKFGVWLARIYKRVWETYGVTGCDRNQTDINWNEAYWAIRGGSPEESFGGANAKQALKNLPVLSPEIKRELLNQIVEDGGPEFKRDLAVYLADDADVKDHWQTRSKVDQAMRDGDERMEQRQREFRQTDPVVRAVDGWTAGMDLSGAISRNKRENDAFVEVVTDAFTRGPNLGMANLTFLSVILPEWAETIERVIECGRRLKAFSETGETDLDAFVDDVLKGANRG